MEEIVDKSPASGNTVRVGVAGASGYAGVELLRILHATRASA